MKSSEPLELCCKQVLSEDEPEELDMSEDAEDVDDVEETEKTEETEGEDDNNNDNDNSDESEFAWASELRRSSKNWSSIQSVWAHFHQM